MPPLTQRLPPHYTGERPTSPPRLVVGRRFGLGQHARNRVRRWSCEPGLPVRARQRLLRRALSSKLLPVIEGWFLASVGAFVEALGARYRSPRLAATTMNFGPTDAGVVEKLVASHREFLAFLERQIGNRAEAEDLLQDAFVRGLKHEQELHDGESARAWFYRMLRNAVIDRHRRSATASGRLQELARALAERTGEAAEAAERIVCACVLRLMSNLPPEQSTALQRIELDGLQVKDFAREAGLTESNAGVRVFRARKALLAQVKTSCGTCADHGCLDCCCGRP